MRKSTAASLGIATIVAAAALAWALWRPPPAGSADPGNADQVAFGERVYRQHCAACHGARLEGQPNWRDRKPDGRLPAPPHDETGHTWHHADKQLFRLTKAGVKPPLAPEGYESDMPAFGGVLSDAQIWAVLAFIKSRWPAHIRTRQERINRASGQRERLQGDRK